MLLHLNSFAVCTGVCVAAQPVEAEKCCQGHHGEGETDDDDKEDEQRQRHPNK